MEGPRKVELVRLAADVSSTHDPDDTRVASDVFPTEHKEMRLVDEAVADAALGAACHLE